VKNGFTVKGFDMSDKQREKAEEAGITPVTTITEVATEVDYIVTALPNT